MATDDVLNAIENRILSVIEKPDREPSLTVEGLKDKIDAMVFPKGPADVEAFLDFSMHAFAASNIYAIPVGGEEFTGDRTSTGEVLTEAYNHQVDKWKQSVMRLGYNEGIIDTITEKAQALEPWRQSQFLSRVFKDLPELTVDDENAVDTEKLRKLAEKLDGLVDSQGYKFDIFQPDTINLGLRLIYRQEWKPVQYQTGELINTIPLAPGEKIKYETKTWQIAKSTEEINDSTTYSTEEILSTTQRDIQEIMKRVSFKFSMTSEASGGVNMGVWKAGGSAKSTTEYQRESKETKKRFREAISKSTQSIKNERKVSINISTEIGSESKMTREISNPNDEITVTYLFYELQRAYDVREYLYDVIPVVYVANDIPTANEIDDDWVIRHDWIIAGAIRDKSFIENLAFTSQEMPGLKFARDKALEVYHEALSVVRAIKDQINAARERIDEIRDSANFSIPQWIEIIRLIREIKALEKRLEPAQTALDKAEEKFSQENFAYEQGRKKVDRLINHVRDNILHYMQAIWNSEHPDQRYLRLRSILYPSIELIGFEIDEDGNPTNPQFRMNDWYPLSDIVDTYNPLGYVGNYTVYRLMRNDNDMVNWMQQNFIQIVKEDQQGHKIEVRKDLNNNIKYIYIDKDDNEIEVGEHDIKEVREVDDPDMDPRSSIKISTPSDAVYIEALAGTEPLLEHFKRTHRAIDMYKAEQEFYKQQLENLRRLELIRKKDFGDPEFDKTIISDAKGLLINKIADMGGDDDGDGDDANGGE